VKTLIRKDFCLTGTEIPVQTCPQGCGLSFRQAGCLILLPLAAGLNQEQLEKQGQS
jgi:hypothetical protein